jgi:uncharacterized coiled-coil protein SlyX
MDQEFSELKERIEALETIVTEQGTMITKLILMIHLSETDLKDHLHVLD